MHCIAMYSTSPPHTHTQTQELEGLLPTRHDPPALEPEAEEVHGYDRVRDEDWAAFNSDTS